MMATTKADQAWIKLECPSMLMQMKLPNPIKINHHQFMVTSAYNREDFKSKNHGIIMHDTHTNEWKQITKHPENSDYDTIGYVAAFNKHLFS